MDSSLDVTQIKIIKGLIAYSAKSELILEEIFSSGILNQLQSPNNIEIIVEDLCEIFSKLPTFFHASEKQIQPLETNLQFIDLLCNLVSSSSPNTVLQISQSFTINFLQKLVQPTICQCFEEEKSNYTSYLQVICENLTNPLLVKNLFEFILSPQIITTFMKRLANAHYADKMTKDLVAILRLFKVLLHFYCEDFWNEVVISYLGSQSHLIKYQRGVVLPEINIEESTARFLSLIPVSVMDVMCLDLETNYLEYSFHEVSRLSFIDSSILDTAAKKYSKQDLSKLTISNQNYPLWVYKYDGTDNYMEDHSDDDEYKTEQDDEIEETTDEELDGESISSSYEPNKNELTLKTETENGKVTPDSEKDLLNIVLGDDDIQNESIKRLISVDPEVATLDWDLDINVSANEFVVIDEETPSTSKAAIVKMQEQKYTKSIAIATLGTFGPLLDCLFDLLQNWCILDMETLLVATEIISILASSRIPMITSILLDTQLILQPSFPSFQRNLNTIRVQLEALLQNYPAVLADTWKILQDHEKHPGRSLKTLIESNLLQQGRSNSNSSLMSTFSTDSRVSVSSLMFNFGQKVRASTPFKLARERLKKLRRGNDNDEMNAGNNMILTERSDPQLLVDNKEQETARLIGIRTLLFSQWLMELGAIAQQTCWRVPARRI